MSIFRKENGSLVKKAGAALVDLTLNANSTNAVSNSAVTAAITQLNNDLDGFMFRNNSGTAEYSIDDGSTWNKL